MAGTNGHPGMPYSSCASPQCIGNASSGDSDITRPFLRPDTGATISDSELRRSPNQ